jgi:DNA-binding LytR/AlgR family response regulator
MIHIAICDDDRELCHVLETQILQYGQQNHLSLDTDVFYSQREWEQALSHGEIFHLLFLDIELPDGDGVSVGHLLHDGRTYENIQIVYISFQTKYALELFKVRPLDFLVKPISKKALFSTLDTYFRLYAQSRCFFQYKSGKQMYSIEENRILYFQSVGRQVHLYTTDREIVYYGKLSEAQKQLHSKNFIPVHKSFLVNLNYVAEYHIDELLMTNHSTIPISHSMKQTVKKNMLKYQMERRQCEA